MKNMAKKSNKSEPGRRTVAKAKRARAGAPEAKAEKPVKRARWRRPGSVRRRRGRPAVEVVRAEAARSGKRRRKRPTARSRTTTSASLTDDSDVTRDVVAGKRAQWLENIHKRAARDRQITYEELDDSPRERARVVGPARPAHRRTGGRWHQGYREPRQPAAAIKRGPKPVIQRTEDPTKSYFRELSKLSLLTQRKKSTDSREMEDGYETSSSSCSGRWR